MCRLTALNCFIAQIKSYLYQSMLIKILLRYIIYKSRLNNMYTEIIILQVRVLQLSNR